MLIAHVMFNVADRDRPAVLKRLTKDAAKVRAMPGCLRFVPFLDPLDSDGVHVMHEWATASDFAAYTRSDLFTAFGAEIRPLMTAPPVSRRFDARLIETAA